MLQTRHTGLSIDQIADRFAVSRRTAERMLAALRERFPVLDYELRDGRKFWRLPAVPGEGAIELPEELRALSQRVAELEAREQGQRRREGRLRRLVDGLTDTVRCGVVVLDRDFRVAWVNPTLEEYLGIDRRAVVGRDKRELVRDAVCKMLEDPDGFMRRVFATYDDNSYAEHFECHVMPAESREERWLEHWSQPITSGPYAGGRIEYYVDISTRVRERQLATSAAGGEASLAGGAIVPTVTGALDELETLLGSGNDPAVTIEQMHFILRRTREALNRVVLESEVEEMAVAEVETRRAYARN